MKEDLWLYFFSHSDQFSDQVFFFFFLIPYWEKWPFFLPIPLSKACSKPTIENASLLTVFTSTLQSLTWNKHADKSILVYIPALGQWLKVLKGPWVSIWTNEGVRNWQLLHFTAGSLLSCSATPPLPDVLHRLKAGGSGVAEMSLNVHCEVKRKLDNFF